MMSNNTEIFEKLSQSSSPKEQLKTLSNTQDEYKEKQKEIFEEEKRKLLIQLQKEDLEDRRQDRSQRREYANKIFYLLCVYLLAIFGVSFCCGAECISFSLSHGVLITMWSTTTANVIALFIVVARYLFPSSNLFQGERSKK